MHVESEVALERDGRGEGIAREQVPEDAVVLACVVLLCKGLVQRIELVAQAAALAAGKIAVDVINRDDGLHQDALPDNALFRISRRVIYQAARPAVMAIERESNVLTEVQLAAVE